jgi:Xaa-Pro aminopeptidase
MPPPLPSRPGPPISRTSDPPTITVSPQENHDQEQPNFLRDKDLTTDGSAFTEPEGIEQTDDSMSQIIYSSQTAEDPFLPGEEDRLSVFEMSTENYDMNPQELLGKDDDSVSINTTATETGRTSLEEDSPIDNSTGLASGLSRFRSIKSPSELKKIEKALDQLQELELKQFLARSSKVGRLLYNYPKKLRKGLP